MAVWQVTVSGKGIRQDTVDKITRALLDKYGEKATVTVKDATPPASRPERFAAAMGRASDARSECEELHSELEEWKDNLPENLQEGSKADEIDEALAQLDEVIQNLQAAEDAEVSFPSMM